MVALLGAGVVCMLALSLAVQTPQAAPLWTLPALDMGAVWPVDPGLRHVGDRLPVRRHDGTGRTYGTPIVVPAGQVAADDTVFASTVDAPAVEPVHEVPADTGVWLANNTARLIVVVAGINNDVDARFVALCERLHIDPVAVTGTVGTKQKGKAHGRSAQEVGVRNVDRSSGPHRGRRRQRGGVRVG